MDVDADPRAAGHILVELGLAVARSGDAVVGTAQVVPEMWVPGTTSLRTSILATWVDHVAGVAAIGVLAPRVPVTLSSTCTSTGRPPPTARSTPKRA